LSPDVLHMDYFFFILLHISNGSVSTSLVGHVLYSADLMSTTCISHILLMVHRYIYSRYSPVFLMLYQLYYSLPSSTLYSSSSLYLKLQPELLLKVITVSSLMGRTWRGNALSQRKEKAMSSVGIWEALGQKGGNGILKVVIVSLFIFYFLSFRAL